MTGIRSRIARGLNLTRELLFTDVTELLSAGGLDAARLDDFEDRLLEADLGPETAAEIRDRIEEASRARRLKEPDEVLAVMENVLGARLAAGARPRRFDGPLEGPPHVVLVVGVNGSGKTTTIGKIAWHYREAGRTVLLAAADTYRAAASEQLAQWATRTGADFVGSHEGADPAAVAFDAIEAATARGPDLLIVDTAGRLHTRVGLMEELAKIRRVLGRRMHGAPHETLLVLDATTGQNGIVQATEFSSKAGVTGLVLTKLDGTARGGIVLPIVERLGIPVELIGVGEEPEDLRPFLPDAFAAALVGRGSA